MLVSKSFLIIGSTIHKNGAPQKDIAEKVDESINSFLKNLVGGKLVDLKPNVQIGTSQDTAFITIIVDVEDPKKFQKEEPKPEPVAPVVEKESLASKHFKDKKKK